MQFPRLIGASTRFALVAVLCAGAAAAQTPLRGVNIAGAEFGEGTIPGNYNQHYTFNSEATFAYFAERGLPLLRVPIRWERIQRQPFSELDADYLGRLEENVRWAQAHGARIIIDVHNYGRYKLEENGARHEYVIDERYSGAVKVSRDALIDLWRRLSAVFADNSGVFGYGLMNEPHDMGSADWKAISQATLAAIRAAGDRKAIFVAGDSWSSAERWQQTHGPQGWITDPANNFFYEAHLYFDSDASGRYQSFDQELAANPNLSQIGRTRLQPFADWCRSNNVQCFVGEYGVPAADRRWLPVLENLLAAMDEAQMGGTYWAGGDWWGDYPLSVHPNGGQDKPQLAVLQEYAGPAFATTVSAASFKEGPQAPGSLASVYGAGFSPETKAAESLPLPSELGGSHLTLALKNNSLRPVELLFVSPTQINYLLPRDLTDTLAELRIHRDGRIVAVETLDITAAAPGLFSASGTGIGPPAGHIVHVAADGTQEIELLADYDTAGGVVWPKRIRFRTPTERVFLTLYGTGFGANVDLQNAFLLFNGAPGPPLAYAGPQRDFPGLDQLNVELPREMIGRGRVSVSVSIQGRRSNELEIDLE